MARRYRIFNGKRYSFYGEAGSQFGANQIAQKLRKRGSSVRVVKSGFYWRIYIRG